MWHSKDCYKTVQYVLNRKIQANLVTVTITDPQHDNEDPPAPLQAKALWSSSEILIVKPVVLVWSSHTSRPFITL